MKNKIVLAYITGLTAFILLAASTVAAQRANTNALDGALDKEGCAITEAGRVKVCKFDYKYKNKTVEALTFRPVANGKYPAVMLIPGYEGTPQRYISLGTILAKLGFASMSVGTPGFGKTELTPDFIGKNTIDAFIGGYKKFKQEPFVDEEKIGVFGYSRGAIAASLLITRVKDVKAAVLGGGIYDLKKAYDELTLEGVKENIKAEAGLTEKAFRERSAIFHVKKINCPVLIIHGEKDINAPTDQAYLLRDKLKEAGKDFEFQILAGADHSNLGGKLLATAVDFLSRKLKGVPANVKFR